MNISLLHHWLVSMRGGEKVLEQFCRLLPDADIHTLVRSSQPDVLSHVIQEHKIYSTMLNRIPYSEQYYKSLLPFFPAAIKTHKVKADFVLSSDASLIKGMNIPDNIPHVCYCHSPPRYLWDLQDDYLHSMNKVKASVFRRLTPYLQRFDLQAAENVDHFIANSQFVSNRINRIYNRESTVIHPPVELNSFQPDKPSEDYYLIVSALVPYKKIDIAVEAFNEMGKPLIIIGDGSELDALKTLSKSNITFMGSQPFKILKKHYEHCRAFVFPGIEDFGITPLEAQAAGKPVLAYKAGGALETVKEGETGIFFEKQTKESLIDAVERFEKLQHEFSPGTCRTNAERFSPGRFRREIKDFLISKYPSYFSDFHWGDKN